MDEPIGVFAIAENLTVIAPGFRVGAEGDLVTLTIFAEQKSLTLRMDSNHARHLASALNSAQLSKKE